jgi:hypothetical protein
MNYLSRAGLIIFSDYLSSAEYYFYFILFEFCVKIPTKSI